MKKILSFNLLISSYYEHNLDKYQSNELKFPNKLKCQFFFFF